MEDREGEEKEAFLDFRSDALKYGVDAAMMRDGREYWVFINCHKNVFIDGRIETTLKFPIRVPAISMAKTGDVCRIALDHVQRIASMIDKGFVDPNAGMLREV